MANVTSLALQNPGTDTVDVVVNGTSYTFTGSQLLQLRKMVNRAAVGASGNRPAQTGATVALPAGYK